MPQQPLIFGPFQRSGLSVLAGGSPISMNVVMDKLGEVRRRPVITEYSEAPTEAVDDRGIDAIHATDAGQIYAIGGHGGGRRAYRLVGGAAVDLTDPGDATTMLRGAYRPVIAETEALLVVACGNEVQKIDLATNLSSRLGGLDTWASHILMNATRLLANNTETDRTVVRWSQEAIGPLDYSGHENWDITGVTGEAGYFTAESRADRIAAIYENTAEVFVFGSGSLEVWKPDENYIYSPVGSSKEHGCIAPYSIIKVDQRMAWLDSWNRFVISDGRELEVISDDIGSDLSGIEDTTDCFGYRIHEDPVDCLVWTFPRDGRTFVYQNGVGWSQWAAWDAELTNWQRFPVNCHHHRIDTDVNIVGLTDGRIAKMEMGGTDDLGDRVVCYVRTGFQNRDTDRKKQCNAVHITLERGGTAGDEQSFALSWADEPGAWTTPVTLSLGSLGQRYPVITLRSLGVYRRRDWKFEFSAGADLKLASVQEDYEVLEI